MVVEVMVHSTGVFPKSFAPANETILKKWFCPNVKIAAACTPYPKAP
jgi:hypothetical protein